MGGFPRSCSSPPVTGGSPGPLRGPRPRTGLTPALALSFLASPSRTSSGGATSLCYFLHFVRISSKTLRQRTRRSQSSCWSPQENCWEATRRVGATRPSSLQPRARRGWGSAAFLGSFRVLLAVAGAQDAFWGTAGTPPSRPPPRALHQAPRQHCTDRRGGTPPDD